METFVAGGGEEERTALAAGIGAGEAALPLAWSTLALSLLALIFEPRRGPELGESEAGVVGLADELPKPAGLEVEPRRGVAGEPGPGAEAEPVPGLFFDMDLRGDGAKREAPLAPRALVPGVPAFGDGAGDGDEPFGATRGERRVVVVVVVVGIGVGGVHG